MGAARRALIIGVDGATFDVIHPLVERADFPRYGEGGVDAQIFAVWIDTIYLPYHCVRRALQLIDAVHRTIEQNADAVARQPRQHGDEAEQAAKEDDLQGMQLGGYVADHRVHGREQESREDDEQGRLDGVGKVGEAGSAG